MRCSILAGEHRSKLVNAGWDRWTSVNARPAGCTWPIPSVSWSGTHNASTPNGRRNDGPGQDRTDAGALGVTAYSRVLGCNVSKHDDVPVKDGTTPLTTTAARRSKGPTPARRAAWAMPAMTSALVLLSAFEGEQQRASEPRR